MSQLIIFNLKLIDINKANVFRKLSNSSAEIWQKLSKFLGKYNVKLLIQN